MKRQIFICLILAVISRSWSAPSKDEVQHLPGLVKQPSWRQYSGYLQASGTRKLHYWFIESEGDPVNDPIVLWLNGGPGCSSLFGLLAENGPYRVLEDGETVTYNPNSWNKVSNLLYLEMPAGVGFSYSDDKNYTFDDNSVSLDNLVALKDFFTKFSEFKTNDFYITGESYGGIYVPTLADRVLADAWFTNFQGFAIGNGISDISMNSDSLLYFLYYHGLVSESSWQEVAKFCCQSNTTRCKFSKAAEKYPMCQNELNKIEKMLGTSSLNPYNLYARCDGGSGAWLGGRLNSFGVNCFNWNTLRSQTSDQLKSVHHLGPHRLHLAIPCVNSKAIIKYLNLMKVRAALHIAPKAQSWTDCSDEVNSHYKRVYDTMAPQYINILSHQKKILVYNGDVDMCCNFLGDEWFVDSLGAKSKGPLKPWYYTDGNGLNQVAGFFKEFHKNFTYVTVKGAGHMVPTDKPLPAEIMFQNFIRNTPF